MSIKCFISIALSAPFARACVPSYLNLANPNCLCTLNLYHCNWAHCPGICPGSRGSWWNDQTFHPHRRVSDDLDCVRVRRQWAIHICNIVISIISIGFMHSSSLVNLTSTCRAAPWRLMACVRHCVDPDCFVSISCTWHAP